MALNTVVLVTAGHEGVAAADHYTYLPLLGLFVPLAAWAAGSLQRAPLALRPWALPVLSLSLIAGLGSLTLAQASLWKDNDALWAGAEKVYPYSALVRMEVGNNLMNHGLLPEAEAAFRSVLAVQPGLPTAYRGLAVVELRQGRTDEAISDLQKALSFIQNDPDVWVYLWKALTQKDRHEEALEQMKIAVQKDPDYALLWNLLGASYGYLGKHQEAVQAFQRALRLDPGNPDFLLNLGDTYLNAGQKTEAADTYDQVLQAAPDSEALQCLVGESYLKANMAREALGPLEKAWEIKQAPRIAADLARAYRLLGQKDQADQYDRLTKEMSSHRP
jgi:tetratricopeptide (TPR) repeat protein